MITGDAVQELLIDVSPVRPGQHQKHPATLGDSPLEFLGPESPEPELALRQAADTGRAQTCQQVALDPGAIGFGIRDEQVVRLILCFGHGGLDR